jgi:hypothetical protein
VLLRTTWVDLLFGLFPTSSKKNTEHFALLSRLVQIKPPSQFLLEHTFRVSAMVNVFAVECYWDQHGLICSDFLPTSSKKDTRTSALLSALVQISPRPPTNKTLLCKVFIRKSKGLQVLIRTDSALFRLSPFYFSAMNFTNKALFQKCRKILQSWDDLNCIHSCPTLQTFPSCSWKTDLFGPVVSDLHEA